MKNKIKLIILFTGLTSGILLGSILGYIYTKHSLPQLGSVANWFSGLATIFGILLTYSHYKKIEFADLNLSVSPFNNITVIKIINSNTSKQFILTETELVMHKNKRLASFSNFTRLAKNIEIDPEVEHKDRGILLNKPVRITFEDAYFTTAKINKNDISEIRLTDNYGTNYSFKHKNIFTKQIKLVAKIK